MQTIKEENFMEIEKNLFLKTIREAFYASKESVTIGKKNSLNLNTKLKKKKIKKN